MSAVKKGGAYAAIVVTLVSGAEGLRQTAYPDPATRGKPWTVCSLCKKTCQAQSICIGRIHFVLWPRCHICIQTRKRCNKNFAAVFSCR